MRMSLQCCASHDDVYGGQLDGATIDMINFSCMLKVAALLIMLAARAGVGSV